MRVFEIDRESVHGLWHLTQFDLHSDRLCLCGLTIDKQREGVHEQLCACTLLMQAWFSEPETLSEDHREAIMSQSTWEANELCWRP